MVTGSAASSLPVSRSQGVTILCVMPGSNYFALPDHLDLYTKERDAYTFEGSNLVIAHPPCSQWSRISNLKRVRRDEREKQLAFFCLEKVKQNGGILEQPAHSKFFKAAGIVPTIEIDQSYFGFPCRKPTWLYFSGCKPVAHPLNFDAITKSVESMDKRLRSKQPLDFCKWLIECVKNKA